ncbi:hypothetical protein Tco_0278804, partial [Tanacetum coccineum]
KVLLLAWEKLYEIKHACREKQHQPEDVQELLRKLLEDLKIISEELVDYINTPNWNCPAFYEDDNEYTIQYMEYLENSSNAITPDLPTEEPDNSLNIYDVPSCDNVHFDAEFGLINSLLSRDISITSPKIDFLPEDFAGELDLIDPILLGIHEGNFDEEEGAIDIDILQIEDE